MENRTGTDPANVYIYVGDAEVRAHPTNGEFLVITTCEPHADGTVRICEAYMDGSAVVWGENTENDWVWYRDDDGPARAAVEAWKNHDGVTQARRLNADVQP